MANMANNPMSGSVSNIPVQECLKYGTVSAATNAPKALAALDILFRRNKYIGTVKSDRNTPERCMANW